MNNPLDSGGIKSTTFMTSQAGNRYQKSDPNGITVAELRKELEEKNEELRVVKDHLKSVKPPTQFFNRYSTKNEKDDVIELLLDQGHRLETAQKALEYVLKTENLVNRAVDWIESRRNCVKKNLDCSIFSRISYPEELIKFTMMKSEIDKMHNDEEILAREIWREERKMRLGYGSFERSTGKDYGTSTSSSSKPEQQSRPDYGTPEQPSKMEYSGSSQGYGSSTSGYSKPEQLLGNGSELSSNPDNGTRASDYIKPEQPSKLDYGSSKQPTKGYGTSEQPSKMSTPKNAPLDDYSLRTPFDNFFDGWFGSPTENQIHTPRNCFEPPIKKDYGRPKPVYCTFKTSDGTLAEKKERLKEMKATREEEERRWNLAVKEYKPVYRTTVIPVETQKDTLRTTENVQMDRDQGPPSTPEKSQAGAPANIQDTPKPLKTYAEMAQRSLNKGPNSAPDQRLASELAENTRDTVPTVTQDTVDAESSLDSNWSFGDNLEEEVRSLDSQEDDIQ